MLNSLMSRVSGGVIFTVMRPVATLVSGTRVLPKVFLSRRLAPAFFAAARGPA